MSIVSSPEYLRAGECLSPLDSQKCEAFNLLRIPIAVMGPQNAPLFESKALEEMPVSNRIIIFQALSEPAFKLEDDVILSRLDAVRTGRVKESKTKVQAAPEGPWFKLTILPAEELEAEDCVIVTVQDITEETLGGETVKEAISRAAHDLKQPLTAISGFAQLAEDALSKDQIEKARIYLAKIRDKTNSAVEDICHALEPRRISKCLNQEVISVTDLLNSAVTKIAPSLEVNGVLLNNTLPDDLLEIKVDKEALLTVVDNLAGNAVDAMAGCGRKELSIWCERSDREIIIFINDTGKGIPEELYEKIFEDGFTEKRDNGQHGTGLGLAICLDIAKKHGGDLWVYSSRIGEGTTFALSLPLNQTA